MDVAAFEGVGGLQATLCRASKGWMGYTESISEHQVVLGSPDAVAKVGTIFAGYEDGHRKPVQR